MFFSIEEYADFVPFSGALGGRGMTMFGTLGSAFESHSSPLPFNMYMCILTEFSYEICTDYLQEVPANSSLHMQII